jgi:hypothetical protein
MEVLVREKIGDFEIAIPSSNRDFTTTLEHEHMR